MNECKPVEIIRTKSSRHYTIRIGFNRGHFNMTGTVNEYVDGKWKELTSGAISQEIAGVFPDLAVFDDLHLRDADGYPSHYAENLAFHMSRTDRQQLEAYPLSPEYVRYCYSLSKAMYKRLHPFRYSAPAMKLAIEHFGQSKRYNRLAAEGIALLQRLRPEWNPEYTPAPKQIDEASMELFQDQLRQGFWTAHSVDQRRAEEIARQLEAHIEHSRANLEKTYRLGLEVLEIEAAIWRFGGPSYRDCILVVGRNKQVLIGTRFNFSRVRNLTDKEVEALKAAVPLPEGYEWVDERKIKV